MYSSHVAHVHGNALTCSISSMVEGSPSCTAHMWLTCTVMPSCVAFPQWWRDIHVWDLLTCGGDIHVWELLTCGGDIHMWLMCTGNALTCSIFSMVERSPSRTAHVWLTCTVMPSRVGFPQWWRGHSRVGLTHVLRGHSRVGITHMWRGHSCVAHVHGNTLTCSISSMVERSPSRTAHVWLTCTVMPSRVAFPQWWRGAPHVQLTCGSRAR